MGGKVELLTLRYLLVLEDLGMNRALVLGIAIFSRWSASPCWVVKARCTLVMVATAAMAATVVMVARAPAMAARVPATVVMVVATAVCSSAAMVVATAVCSSAAMVVATAATAAMAVTVIAVVLATAIAVDRTKRPLRLRKLLPRRPLPALVLRSASTRCNSVVKPSRTRSDCMFGWVSTLLPCWSRPRQTDL